MAMDQGVVEEWLSEFKVRHHLQIIIIIIIMYSEFQLMCVFWCVFQTLEETAVYNYAVSLKEKGSLVPALYKVIRENYSDVRDFLLLFFNSLFLWDYFVFSCNL